MIIGAFSRAAYLCAAALFCGRYLGESGLGTESKPGTDPGAGFHKSKGQWLFFFLSFVSYLLIEAANQSVPGPYILYCMLNQLVFAVLVLALFPADRGRKMLAVSMLLAVRAMVIPFCDSGLSCVLLFWRHSAAMVSQPLLSEWENTLICCFSFAVAVCVIDWLSKRVSPIFFKGGQRNIPKSQKWYITWAVPLLVLVVMLDVAEWGASNGIMIRSGGGRMGLYYDQIFSHAQVCVQTFLSMLAAGFYMFGLERIDEEQQRSFHYHAQAAVYKMMAEQYQRTERLRHDMKNHIIALSGLCKDKEWEKIGHYLKRLESAGLEGDGDLTGSRVVDALLCGKRQWARKKKIRWECDVQIPRASGISEFDLCIIFGNLLDNALEACERVAGEGRFIHMQAGMVKSYFLLEIKNSTDSTVSRGVSCDAVEMRGAGVMHKAGVTHKGNTIEHGIGLQNVSDVVNQYNGSMNLEAEDGTFTVTILLPRGDSVRT